MSLIKSISGIRGTIGGKAGEGLNPLDIVKFTAAYATFIRKNSPVKTNKIVVGRDARISGEMVKHTVIGTLMGMGFDVVNIGLATTPTTEIAVTMEKACGGIILTASHNPKQWNALKLLNEKGEFLNAAEGQEVLRIAEAEDFEFAEVDELGQLYVNNTYTQKHIESVLALDLVDVDAIRKANFTVAIDCVNSVGGIVIPALLKALGVKNIIELNCTPDGKFPHNPEPLPENLTQIAGVMKEGRADVGFVVDPDVDRLAIVCENGDMFVEEYTLVAVADYVLKHTPGNTVSNLSSSRALRDVTRSYGQQYNASAVGEVNVVTLMKQTGAVIGGDGAAQTLNKLGSVNAVAGAFMVGLSAALSIYWMTKGKVPVSTSQAIVGAIIGWNLYSDKPTDLSIFSTIVSTWVFCPILAGIFAVIIYHLCRLVILKAKIPLIRQDFYTRLGLILAGAFGAYALGANNIANVMGVFVTSNQLHAVTLFNSIELNAEQVLFLLGGIAISVGIFTYSKRIMMTVGNNICVISPLAAWVVVIAQSLVLFLFASQDFHLFLENHGLPSIPLVPVSSSQAVIGGVIGIGLIKGGHGINWGLIRRIFIGWIVTPVIAAGLCYIALFFLQNVFNLTVYH